MINDQIDFDIRQIEFIKICIKKACERSKNEESFFLVKFSAANFII